MASIRKRVRQDGTATFNVMYSLKGRQTSVTFTNEREAGKFRDAIDSFGPVRAMEAWGIGDTIRAQPAGMLLEDWLQHYISHLTGVTKATLYDYESYARLYINPKLGAIPLTALSRDDVARWVNEMAETPNRRKQLPSGKTLANRHGFLSAALNAAVKAEKMPSNPALGTRLPRTEKPEMVFLSREDFNRILAEIPERWKPFTRFLVVSGARFGEASALRPSDVDRDHNTVRIRRAFKRTYAKGGYELGPTKTRKSNRDISIDRSVLNDLNYTQEWLFTTKTGSPVRVSNFRANVWWPAVARAKVSPRPRVHDLRHTCASWLIQSGQPLPVIQQHLGHESIEVTVGVYGHLDRRSADAAAAVLADIVARPKADLDS